MTFREVAEMIESIGLPYAYYQFFENEVPSLPYIIYYYPTSDNFEADDKVYQHITNMNLELYSKNKNFELEQQVEAVLDEFNIVWNKTETYIDTEHMYEVLYESEVVINA